MNLSSFECIAFLLSLQNQGWVSLVDFSLNDCGGIFGMLYFEVVHGKKFIVTL